MSYESIDTSGFYKKVVDEKRLPLVRISKTAWVELSQASGLALIEKENRNPGLTSTYGTGLSINHAIESGCSEIILRRLRQMLKLEIDKDGKIC